MTHAAEQLGVTQSAMSHSLSRLRTWFADPLFVRVGSAMQPTPRALELAPVALQIMASVRSGLLSQAGFAPANSTRRFTLCMTDMCELVFLPPLIAQLRAQAPHCTP
ncbi:MAG: LysR family transcriptional regulator [Candidatus Protistobacter heckmanni]|nr:LysR family transcriptional regulator [Candidatus Protistobacter heckmanni]